MTTPADASASPERAQRLDRTLPEIGEAFLRDAAVLKVASSEHDGEFVFDDDWATKCAWGAHGYATEMVPFYSAGQMKAAMLAAHSAGIRQGTALQQPGASIDGPACGLSAGDAAECASEESVSGIAAIASATDGGKS